MNRSTCLVAAVFACGLSFCVGDVRAANLNFNFNADSEGWTFGTIPPVSGTTPSWQWYKGPSSNDGGLQAFLVASGSGAGAFALSPCLEILQESQTQRYIDVDFSHYTLFPQNILGQVQFQIDNSGTWQGIPTSAWKTVNHVPPTEPNVFPPLLTSPGAPPNVWLAFSGTNDAGNNPTASTGSGPHVLSAFRLNWDDYGLSNGSEIEFRFLIGVNQEYPTQSPVPILWEINNLEIDGAKLCVVPEPGSLALAGCALACGVAGSCRRRRLTPRSTGSRSAGSARGRPSRA